MEEKRKQTKKAKEIRKEAMETNMEKLHSKCEMLEERNIRLESLLERLVAQNENSRQVQPSSQSTVNNSLESEC